LKQYVIVVAGGKGTRMGTEIPKQFLELNGKAIILHTLEKFSKALPQATLFLVLPKSQLTRWKEISKHTSFQNIEIAFGGLTRFDSVKSGLTLIKEEGVIGIHDAVRPLVSVSTIENVFSSAEKTEAAIPVVELKDSLRQLNMNHSKAVNRSSFRIVQTPQCFTTKLLKKAYQQTFKDNFTDDATVVESLGKSPSLVEGNYENIKITTMEDLRLAEAFLA